MKPPNLIGIFLNKARSMPYRVGQPQGIAPTKHRVRCRGNPLWLPLTAPEKTFLLRVYFLI